MELGGQRGVWGHLPCLGIRTSSQWGFGARCCGSTGRAGRPWNDGIGFSFWSFTSSCSVSYRDLKVSNLLMTDKGCVKIGESQHLHLPGAALCHNQSSELGSLLTVTLLQLILAWHAPTGCPLSP